MNCKIIRGRFGRLPAFMATWFKTKNEITTGIGIDDHTALCIDTSGVARAFGTGAVSIFKPLDKLPFDISVDMLKSGKTGLTQLLHGCTINIKTGTITGFSNPVQPAENEENQAIQLFFSGTDYPSDDACEVFVNKTGTKTDAIAIITGNNTNRANDVKLKIQEKTSGEVNIVQAIPANQNDNSTKSNIEKARKLIFIANNYPIFMDFLNSGGNGLALKQKTETKDISMFFVGDNARFAGKTVIDKYTGSGATSYNGTLGFLPGLGLLKTTVIMPNAFINPETYENTVSGIPYAMVSNSLKYGIYITGNTFAKYSFTSEGISVLKNLSGSFPLIVLNNYGTKGGLANQGPNSTSRNVVGFENMELQFLGISDSIITGNHVALHGNKDKLTSVKVFPNPASNILYLKGTSGRYVMNIFDGSGKILSNLSFTGNCKVNLVNFPDGFYLIKITHEGSGEIFQSKLVVRKK